MWDVRSSVCRVLLTSAIDAQCSIRVGQGAMRAFRHHLTLAGLHGKEIPSLMSVTVYACVGSQLISMVEFASSCALA